MNFYECFEGVPEHDRVEYRKLTHRNSLLIGYISHKSKDVYIIRHDLVDNDMIRHTFPISTFEAYDKVKFITMKNIDRKNEFPLLMELYETYIMMCSQTCGYILNSSVYRRGKLLSFPPQGGPDEKYFDPVKLHDE